MIDGVETRRLQLLIELSRLGSMRAVADELGVTTSTVSQQVAALAREVGVALVEPVGRRVRLTPAGRRLAEHAVTIVAAVEAARSDLSPDTEPAGTVRVAGFATAVRRSLLPLVADLAVTHPRVRLLCYEHEPAEALGLLGADDVDLALVYDYNLAPVAFDRGVEATALWAADWALGAPAEGNLGAAAEGNLGAAAEGNLGAVADGDLGVPADGDLGVPADGDLGVPADGDLGVPADGDPGVPADGDPGAPADGDPGAPAVGGPGAPEDGAARAVFDRYRRHDWIVNSRNTADDQVVRAIAAMAGFEPRITHRADSLDLVQDLVAAGLGVGLLPADMPTRPGVVRRALDDPRVTLRCYAVVRGGRSRWPPLALLLDRLLAGKPDRGPHPVSESPG